MRLKKTGAFANKFTRQSFLCLQDSINHEEINERWRRCDFKPSTDLSRIAVCYYEPKALFWHATTSLWVRSLHKHFYRRDRLRPRKPQQTSLLPQEQPPHGHTRRLNISPWNKKETSSIINRTLTAKLEATGSPLTGFFVGFTTGWPQWKWLFISLINAILLNPSQPSPDALVYSLLSSWRSAGALRHRRPRSFKTTPFTWAGTVAESDLGDAEKVTWPCFDHQTPMEGKWNMVDKVLLSDWNRF